MEEFGEIYIEHVFVLEFANAVVYALYPPHVKRVKPHGEEFREVCKYFGISSKASIKVFSNSSVLKENRKRLDLAKAKKSKKSSVKKITFDYHCKCNEYHKFSKTRHKNALNGSLYRCKRCKSIIERVDYY